MFGEGIKVHRGNEPLVLHIMRIAEEPMACNLGFL